MNHQYTYQGALAASEKINWRVEEIIGGDKQLDFTRPFMPEALARVDGLAFLTPDERRVLNQIRGYEYLCMFGVVEEFILPFVVDHARPYLNGDDYRVRAFLQFASEEAKHIHLFRRFRDEFERGFSSECSVIGPADAIGRTVLSHHPLAVALAILQVEWMTQRHFIDSVKDEQSLDPLFKSLLRHHWMEEAQHAKLDTLMVEALAEKMTEKEIEDAVEDYLKIGGFLDSGLMMQVEFDIDCLKRATNREFTEAEQDQIRKAQQQAVRWTFLGSGMVNENFLGTLERLSPAARNRVEQVAPAFC